MVPWLLGYGEFSLVEAEKSCIFQWYLLKWHSNTREHQIYCRNSVPQRSSSDIPRREKSPQEVENELGFICEIEVDLLLGAKCRHTRREWRSKSLASVANGKYPQPYIDSCSKLSRFFFLFVKPISSPIIERKEKDKSRGKLLYRCWIELVG